MYKIPSYREQWTPYYPNGKLANSLITTIHKLGMLGDDDITWRLAMFRQLVYWGIER